MTELRKYTASHLLAISVRDLSGEGFDRLRVLYRVVRDEFVSDEDFSTATGIEDLKAFEEEFLEINGEQN